MKYSALLKKCALKTGLPLPTIKLVAGTLFEEILLSLSMMQKVKIAKFGTFELRSRKNGNEAGYIKISQARLVKRLLELFKSSIGDNSNGEKS